MQDSKHFRRLALTGLGLILPLAVLLVYFAAADPMKCFRMYSNPLEKGVTMNDRIFQSRWLASHPFPYDAFILGSSRGKSFHTEPWKQYTGASCPFHMCVNDESIYGIARKLEYLEKEKYEIRHVLLLLDHRILGRPYNPEPHIFREYPAVSGESPAAFYQRFLIAFLKPSFLKAWVLHSTADVEDQVFFFSVDFRYNLFTGDHIYAEYESRLAEDEDLFYREQASVFYDRPASMQNLEPVITRETISELERIASLLDRNHSNYQVVITPNYDQLKMHPDDLEVLFSLFGRDRIHDFSGVNNYTQNIRHYYEERHFRPFIADSIMAQVYQRKP